MSPHVEALDTDSVMVLEILLIFVSMKKKLTIIIKMRMDAQMHLLLNYLQKI